jgi:hypothetical protein
MQNEARPLPPKILRCPCCGDVGNGSEITVPRRAIDGELAPDSDTVTKVSHLLKHGRTRVWCTVELGAVERVAAGSWAIAWISVMTTSA